MDNKKMTALNEMELENVNGGILLFDDIVVIGMGVCTLVVAAATYLLQK